VSVFQNYLGKYIKHLPKKIAKSFNFMS